MVNTGSTNRGPGNSSTRTTSTTPREGSTALDLLNQGGGRLATTLLLPLGRLQILPKLTALSACISMEDIKVSM